MDSFLYTIFLYASPVLGALGLLAAYQLYLQIVKLPDGNDRMREIAKAIREGAFAYLIQQARILVPIIAVVFLLIWLGLNFNTGIAFVVGAGASILAGFLGMSAATMANVRTAQAASEAKADQALLTAFNGGAVMGMSVASLGVLGVGILYIIWGTPAESETLIGFAVGASSVALFARVGGGIYTKAADVGADLVGKVEAGIPEDDPRNPGVIADNVGDNVGDVAGMGADIFETYVTSIIGCIALGATIALSGSHSLESLTSFKAAEMATQVNDYKSWLMLTPVAIGLLGAIASYFSILLMKSFKGGDPAVALRNMTLISSVLFLALGFVFFLFTPVNLSLWVSIVFGTV
ncbi:MAG: hypothetical protein RL417_661, partial [Pseudomonadota bacterium]